MPGMAATTEQLQSLVSVPALGKEVESRVDQAVALALAPVAEAEKGVAADFVKTFRGFALAMQLVLPGSFTLKDSLSKTAPSTDAAPEVTAVLREGMPVLESVLMQNPEIAALRGMWEQMSPQSKTAVLKACQDGTRAALQGLGLGHWIRDQGE